MESCATCRFWMPSENVNAPGVCRRFPPKPFLVPMMAETPGRLQLPRKNPNSIQMQLMTHFPATDPQIWCGEFKPIEGEAK